MDSGLDISAYPVRVSPPVSSDGEVCPMYDAEFNECTFGISVECTWQKCEGCKRYNIVKIFTKFGLL